MRLNICWNNNKYRIIFNLNIMEKWIQKVNKDIEKKWTKWKCTPITKAWCTWKAKILAMTFRKINKKRYGK